MIGIVVSRADRASEHIGEQLLSLVDWDRLTDDSRRDADGGGVYYRRPGFELRTFDELHIDMTDPSPAFGTDRRSPEAIAFVSRHSGETGPLLTAHFTGNFGGVEFGGREGDLARTAPAIQKRLVRAFDQHAPDGYDVGIECTHHGPTAIDLPSLFVELGSGEPEWNDPDGAAAVARSVLELVDDQGTPTPPDLLGPDGRPRQLVGFGGGHYAPRFERIVRETDWAVGHVGSDWQLDELGAPAASEEVLEDAFEASRAEHALIEGTKPQLVETVEQLGYRVVTETWLREVGDRPLAMVGRLEDELATVEEGLRFGAVQPTDGVRNFETAPLPAELLAEAQGIDADAAREAVETHAVAFETEQAGTRAAGRAAFADASDRDALVDALAAVLRRQYEEVTREDGDVVARTEGFDPERAVELGVPEGPAFGKLSAGQPVTVDGETIEPGEVTTERVERFPVEQG
ncbi:D-aminoacyl-tRNA deacylase [Halalkaliarchaeum desulfuricum]|uniref:D-aminoacyl-tRNA deacylase n=1 Tax=Halalkaliarchaeum desulfuricum TaxID=2055893 RepID=UPI000E6D1F4E|nr:D-aminoacyl-tRNA deacylase [Halalkaliarchaeum desulfuricum]